VDALREDLRQGDAAQASKSSFSIALICTTSRWIPARARTNQGPEKCDLIQVDAFREDLRQGDAAQAALAPNQTFT